MRWSWHGAVALILALCVGVGWAVAIVVSALHPEDTNRPAAFVLYALGGALVGGVVTWLGGRDRHTDDDGKGP